MRIEIKTHGKVNDPDLRALYILRHALENEGTPQMLKANLEYIADYYGFKLESKEIQK